MDAEEQAPYQLAYIIMQIIDSIFVESNLTYPSSEATKSSACQRNSPPIMELKSPILC